MNLLLLTEADRISGDLFQVTGRRAEHIKCVLRAVPGGRIKAGLLGGNIGIAELRKVERNCVELVCPAFDIAPPESSEIVPVISLPRPQSFKKTLHFIASSGIKKACFITSEKVEKSYWKSGAMTPAAIEEELILGLEQGVDTILPQLEFRRSFRDFVSGGELAELSKNAEKIIAHPMNDAPPCPCGSQGTTWVAIGPEGGYTPGEVEAFLSAGYTPVTLGRHILRVEFALAYLCGRLSGCPSPGADGGKSPGKPC